MNFIRSVIYSTWLRVMIWVVIGIGVNTTPPHYPSFNSNLGAGVILHSIMQYTISVTLWPLSFWSPTFTVGKWTGP